MRALIIHHLETAWESGYRRFGTSLEEQVERLLEHLDETSYDLIILTRFEDWELEPETSVLGHYINEIHDYGYGWCHEMFDEDETIPDDFVQGGTHSELVWIPDWLRRFDHEWEVDLCGAFVGECLEDIEIALNAVGVSPNLLSKLCVG